MSARRTNGTRAISRVRSTCRRATFEQWAEDRIPTRTRPRSSTARAACGPRWPPTRSPSSVMGTSSHGRRVQPLKDSGLPWKKPDAGLTPEQAQRYSRHLLIPEVGEAVSSSFSGARSCSSAPVASGRPRSLPGRRRRWDARHRRLGRRRRDEPPAPDPAYDRADRRAEDRVRAPDIGSAQPRRKDRRLPGARYEREHRPDPPRVRRHHRWRRHFPTAISSTTRP